MEKINKGTVIGFIGIGVMGENMARNLLKAGYVVHVYTRTKERAMNLLADGAVWKNSPKEIVLACEVIMTMVGYPYDVEEIYLGENGLLHHAKEGTIFIDFTTSTPSLAKELYKRAKDHQMYSLDAPVSGGDIGARDGKLAIMVGGDKDIFEKVLPLLEVLGTNIILQGKAGSGQHTKMCNQIAIASNMLGVCEAMAYARKAGLDQEQVLKSISTGAAGSWSLCNLAPRMIRRNFEPGFFVKHFIKDMKIAVDEANAMGLELLGLQLSKELYEIIAENGEENSGTHALYKSYIGE